MQWSTGQIEASAAVHVVDVAAVLYSTRQTPYRRSHAIDQIISCRNLQILKTTPEDGQNSCLEFSMHVLKVFADETYKEGRNHGQVRYCESRNTYYLLRPKSL